MRAENSDAVCILFDEYVRAYGECYALSMGCRRVFAGIVYGSQLDPVQVGFELLFGIEICIKYIKMHRGMNYP